MQLQHIDRDNSLPDISLVAHIEQSLNSISDLFDGSDDEYLDVDLQLPQR